VYPIILSKKQNDTICNKDNKDILSQKEKHHKIGDKIRSCGKICTLLSGTNRTITFTIPLQCLGHIV
jgi:hypothetical protein